MNDKLDDYLTNIAGLFGSTTPMPADVQDKLDWHLSNIISAIESGMSTGWEVEVKDVLPATGESGVLYLIPNSGSGSNIYDEYVWIATASNYEKLGSTEIDLSSKQDALTFDSSPTSGSTNPVTSGGVYTAISAIETTIAGIEELLEEI